MQRGKERLREALSGSGSAATKLLRNIDGYIEIGPRDYGPDVQRQPLNIGPGQRVKRLKDIQLELAQMEIELRRAEIEARQAETRARDIAMRWTCRLLVFSVVLVCIAVGCALTGSHQTASLVATVLSAAIGAVSGLVRYCG